MKRWAWDIFCMLSLVVLAGSVTIWVRSYFVGDWVVRTTTPIVLARGRSRVPWTGVRLGWSSGSMTIIHFGADFPEAVGKHEDWEYWSGPPQQAISALIEDDFGTRVPFQGWQCFARGYNFGSGRVSQHVIVFPLWVFLPAAIPPLIWWRRYRRRNTRGFPVTLSSSSKESGDREVAKSAKGDAKD